MLTKVALLSASLLIASAGLAANAPGASTTGLTASAARKAHTLRFADGDREDIFTVDAGPNDSVKAVEVVANSLAVKVPGNTISAGDKPHELKTSLKSSDVIGRN